MSAERYVDLYFVRHGQTDWNRRGILQGKADNPLNQTGRDQADARARKLEHIVFKNVYSSPLLRTLETASRIVTYRSGGEIVPLSALRERDYGECENKDYLLSQDARHAFLKSDQSLINNPHGIETDKQLEGRLIPILRHIATAHLSSTLKGPTNDLFVTHSGVMRFLLKHFGYMNYENMEHYKIEETACMKVRFDGKSFEVKNIEGFTNRDNK